MHIAMRMHRRRIYGQISDQRATPGSRSCACCCHGAPGNAGAERLSLRLQVCRTSCVLSSKSNTTAVAVRPLLMAAILAGPLTRQSPGATPVAAAAPSTSLQHNSAQGSLFRSPRTECWSLQQRHSSRTKIKFRCKEWSALQFGGLWASFGLLQPDRWSKVWLSSRTTEVASVRNFGVLCTR